MHVEEESVSKPADVGKSQQAGAAGFDESVATSRRIGESRKVGVA
ncbi:MAG: hypothetical protein AAGI08_12425 [Bacteroidota bacterium]